MLQHSPSVQMANVPPDAINDDDKLMTEDPDVRINQEQEDRMVEAKNEFYDGDKDQDKDDVEM